jgi:UDP-N-acetylmuramoylalanine--D-glutamate ligase
MRSRTNISECWMQVTDLKDKKVVIWGLGHEGKALGALIRRDLPHQVLTFVDEAAGPSTVDGFAGETIILRGKDNIKEALAGADILIKSPGVSLYHPLVKEFAASRPVTSLFNLWAAAHKTALLIGVTGSKGKSTTSNLLAHTLKALGQKTALGGNIGVPVAEIDGSKCDYAVIEVSSYQAADFDQQCDVGILTSLFPDHLDWHGSVERYYTDKLNLLAHSKTRILNAEAVEILKHNQITVKDAVLFNDAGGMHHKDGKLYNGNVLLGALQSPHLSRAHNLSNVCAVLTAIHILGLDLAKALGAMESYKPLPHRQQELGERDGVLYVNDSISTTPQAAIAALEAYKPKPTTLIAGGFDRGIDYQPLVDYVLKNNVDAVICMGPSGKRIHDLIKAKRTERLFLVETMRDAIALAKASTKKGGVILLSPAAPSYGLFKDFIARGKSFADESGLRAD